MPPTAFTWTTSVDDIRIALDATSIAVMIAFAVAALAFVVPSARRVHPLLLAIAVTGGLFVGVIAFADSFHAITSTSVASIAAACAEVLIATCVVAGLGGVIALLAMVGIGASLVRHLPDAAGVDGTAPPAALVEAKRAQPPVEAFILATGFAALGLASISTVFAFMFAADLRGVGAIPRVESRGCTQVHVGLECIPRLKPFAHNRVIHERQLLFFPTGRTFPKPLLPKTEAQRSYDDAAGWAIPPVVMSAIDQGRGKRTATSVAVRDGIRVTRPLTFDVAENKADPRFSPEVGDAWRFSRAERHTRVHLFVFDNSTTTTSNAELRVTHSVVIDGKNAFVVTRKGFEAERSFVVAGVDGIALHRPFVDDTAAWKPLIESEDAPFTDVLPGDLAKLSEAGVSACTVGFLPPSSCACFKHPIDESRQKAGPLFCRLRSRDSGIGTALVAVLTLGLVIEGSDRPVYTLISSGPHEELAPLEAPPAGHR